MADVSACSDNNCTLFHKCYRAQCEKNPYWQSYIVWDENAKEEHLIGKCDYFWEIRQ